MKRLEFQSETDPEDKVEVELSPESITAKTKTKKITVDLQGGFYGVATIKEMADILYGQVYKGIDDKVFRKAKTSEMADWLAEGDLRDKPTLEALSAEWLEYDQEPEREEV